MPTTELTADAIAVLRMIDTLRASHQVPTIQAAAIGARVSYMDAYDLVNQLFSAGLLTHELKLTEAGAKVIG